MTDIDTNALNEIAEKAGAEILRIYHDERLFNVVDFKADDSPLTLADQQSNQIIISELISLYPDIPILSEEGKDIPYEERRLWERFWLIDPLDGTKEFIKRNGEFTVNIALIVNGFPVFGIIYAPVLNLIYFGMKGEGSYKIENGNKIKLECSDKKRKGLIAVRSRSHASPEEDAIYKKYNVTEFISVGSSLKFCMVAEGKADLYCRHGPTMEWDTAAGQAIAENAGYTVNDLENRRFQYNKESLLNGSFIVK